MHIVVIILLILVIIFSPAIIGATAFTLAIIGELLIKMSIPLSLLFISYWVLSFIEKKKNGNLMLGRWMFVISVMIGSIISLILWIGEQYAISCLVFLISVIYQLAKRYDTVCTQKYDDWTIYAAGLILSWYIPMVMSAMFFYDYSTLSRLGISDYPGLTTVFIAVLPLCLIVFAFFEKDEKGANSAYAFVKQHKLYSFSIIICAILGVLSNLLYLSVYRIIKSLYYNHIL